MKKIKKQDICSKCGGEDITKHFREKGSDNLIAGSTFIEYKFYPTVSGFYGIIHSMSVCKNNYITDTLVCQCSCGYTWDTLPLDSNLKEKDILKQSKESEEKAEYEKEVYLEMQKEIEAKKDKIKEELINEKYDNLIEEPDKETWELQRPKPEKPFWCKWFCK